MIEKKESRQFRKIVRSRDRKCLEIRRKKTKKYQIGGTKYKNNETSTNLIYF
jgi:hypothetical protein